MSELGQGVFWLSALIAVVGALCTVASRRPLRAAFGLLVHIVGLAAILLTLQAHLLAVLQLLIYAGAVVVLFIFVIMLIGPDAEAPMRARGWGVRALNFSLMAVAVLAIAAPLASHDEPWVAVEDCRGQPSSECRPFGGVAAVGSALFREAIVPFELVGLLLVVAVVGALAIAQSKAKATKTSAAAKPIPSTTGLSTASTLASEEG